MAAAIPMEIPTVAVSQHVFGRAADTKAVWAGEDRLATALLDRGAVNDFGCFVARQRLAWAWCVTASSEFDAHGNLPLANVWKWYNSVIAIGQVTSRPPGPPVSCNSQPTRVYYLVRECDL